MYIAPNGTGKSFTVMETAIDSSTPPEIGTPWQTIQKNGKTFYENNVSGYRSGLAMINNGVLYLVSNDSGLNITQLEQILQSLNVPVRTAPDMIKTQTFGFAKVPTAVPFIALLPNTIPFKWNTKTAVGVDVTTFRGNVKQDMGRNARRNSCIFLQ
jgi:hypothetical protein